MYFCWIFLFRSYVAQICSVAGGRRTEVCEQRNEGRKFKGQGWGDREKRRVSGMRREEEGKFNSGEGLVLGMGGGEI
jgi:hypothetical protein